MGVQFGRQEGVSVLVGTRGRLLVPNDVYDRGQGQFTGELDHALLQDSGRTKTRHRRVLCAEPGPAANYHREHTKTGSGNSHKDVELGWPCDQHHYACGERDWNGFGQ